MSYMMRLTARSPEGVPVADKDDRLVVQFVKQRAEARLAEQ
jgi:hypothetical protein